MMMVIIIIIIIIAYCNSIWLLFILRIENFFSPDATLVPRLTRVSNVRQNPGTR